MSGQYLTPDEVADQLKVTPKSVRAWLRSGELIGIKVGKNWRVHPGDLDRYLDEQRVGVLMTRAREKQPDIEWIEGSCRNCGDTIPVPERGAWHWVCSVGCKHENDTKAANLVGWGNEDFISLEATVVPRY